MGGSFSEVTDLIGKLVQIQRGPATVNGSNLHIHCTNLYGKEQETMTISQETCLISYAPTQPTRIGGVRTANYINVTSLSASPYPQGDAFLFFRSKKVCK